MTLGRLAMAYLTAQMQAREGWKTKRAEIARVCTLHGGTVTTSPENGICLFIHCSRKMVDGDVHIGFGTVTVGEPVPFSSSPGAIAPWMPEDGDRLARLYNEDLDRWDRASLLGHALVQRAKALAGSERTADVVATLLVGGALTTAEKLRERIVGRVKMNERNVRTLTGDDMGIHAHVTREMYLARVKAYTTAIEDVDAFFPRTRPSGFLSDKERRIAWGDCAECGSEIGHYMHCSAARTVRTNP